jgi:alpha-amylase
LENRLFYDRERRASLVERFMPPGTLARDIQENRAMDRGGFAAKPFAIEKPSVRQEGGALLNLCRDGWVEQEGKKLPVRVCKNLVFARGDMVLGIDYAIHNRGEQALKTRFLSEWNLTLLAGDAPDRNYFVEGKTLADSRLVSVGEESDVKRAGMTDGWLRLRVALESDTPSLFLRYPVETVSQSEGGFERVYQGSCLLWGWDLEIGPGQSVERKLVLRLEGIRP